MLGARIAMRRESYRCELANPLDHLADEQSVKRPSAAKASTNVTVGQVSRAWFQRDAASLHHG